MVMAHRASERGMSIEYTKVDAANRQAFYETLLTFWDQRWDRDFQQELLDWRYARRAPGGDARCAVALPVHRAHRYFPSLYRVGGQQVLVREPCDWYCLPGNRGVGMRLMKWLISQKEPLLGVGLPKAAIAIAPRLNWKHLLDTHDFVLPITA
jgi:hypothetical protein